VTPAYAPSVEKTSSDRRYRETPPGKSGGTATPLLLNV
jgi:hypothetical protein